MSLRGIDVSNWQRTIDWAQVSASGIEFGIAKASEGTNYPDPFLAANLQGMRANNVLPAVYHFARPDRTSPTTEAAWFLRCIGKPQAELVVCLDLEVGFGDLSQWTLSWLQTVEAAVGCKPLLYTSPSFIQEHGLAVPALQDYGLWLASWQATQPPVPAPWPFIAIWQNATRVAIPGIVGPVDTDVFNGDRDQFVRYGVPAPPVPAATNDDLIQTERLMLAGDLAGARDYLERFV